MSRPLPQLEPSREQAGAPAFAERRLPEWLAEWERLGTPRQARAAARAVYQGQAPWELPELTRPLREHLLRLRPSVPLPEVRERLRSPDGAEKLLLELGAGLAVETVLIPEARSRRSRERMQAATTGQARRPLERRPARASGCVSTQVGCTVGCRFCASGLQGLVRNLTAGQIVAQAVHLRALAQERGYHLGTLVVMGMGEPFHNTDALLGALSHLASPAGFQLGPNYVSVSTVGVPEGIARLAAEGPAVNLALSLHAPEDGLRAELIPLARRLPPVAELCRLVADYARRTRREVSISYVLLAGINDDPAQARDLAALLLPHPELRHVNLIPWNPVGGLDYQAPDAERVQDFFQALRQAGILVHVRRTRGAEEAAACGQLRLRAEPPAPRRRD